MSTRARRFPLLLALGSLLLGTCLVFFQATTARAAGPTVQVVLTTSNGSSQLATQANLTFGANTGNSSTINVNEYQELQQMTGFGAAVTDSSAWLLDDNLSASQRTTVMQNLFSPTQGIGLSYVRIPMGASDFSRTGAYSYDDLPAGQTDPNLTDFSISHDLAYIIPILQQARSINPNLTFMANPWSPPAWMKTNGSMFGVNSSGVTGTLNAADYGPLAQYFVKFIQAYQAQGIPISAITPQNEPEYAPNNYPGMSWAASDEENFIKNYLSPALVSAGLSTQILGYDHNWNDTSFANTLLSDATTRNDLSAIAWHCYAGSASAMTTIHNSYPTKGVQETECATGAAVTPIDTIDLLMQSVQNYAQTVELWNLALDPNNGPHTGGCPDCLGVVTINEANSAVTYSNDYYLLGQFSKFAVPGAYHISSNNVGNVEDVAFKNPDGSKVVVAHNNDTTSDTFQVLWGGQGFTYTLPAGATVTFKWSGTQQTTLTNGGYAVNAGGAASSSFQSDNYYLGGYSNTATVTDTISTSGVTNPAPQAVYQSQRYGNFSYAFPGLQAGASYTVRLHFAETYWTSSGQRVFNVGINGSPVLSNFDIFAAAGAKDQAVVKQFTATADSTGQLAIQFSSVTDYAEVNGIEIIPVSAGGSTTTTIDDSVQGTGLNQFNYTGTGWSHCTSCDSNNYGFYNASNSWDSTANDAVSVTFTGTQIKFYGVTGPAHGIGAVSLDGGAETNIDFYAATNAGNTLLYTSPVLASGQHTLKVRVTGTENASATWTGINPDRVDVISGSTATTTTVDDSVQGTAANQFNYTGTGWSHCTSCDGSNYGFYNASNSWDSTANDAVTVTFTGTQVKFYGVVGPAHGIGAISLDGGAETNVDFYAATNAGNTLLYTSPVLASGQHTLKVRVTGTENASATWTGINPDRVDIIS